MTISFASCLCSSMSAISRLCVSRLSACSAMPSALRGRALQRAGVPGGQHVDLAGAELDGMGDRRVVRDAAVHQLPVLPRDGREHGGDGGAGDDRIEERAGGEQQLLAGDHVDGDDVQRDRQVLELLGARCSATSRRSPESGTRWARVPRKPSRPLSGLSGKIWLRLTWRQIVAELVGGLDGLRSGGDERAVDRPGGGGHDQVGLRRRARRGRAACRPGSRPARRRRRGRRRRVRSCRAMVHERRDAPRSYLRARR